MSSLKDMYRTVLKDTFPDTMTITLGDAVLTYKNAHGTSTAKPRAALRRKPRSARRPV